MRITAVMQVCLMPLCKIMIIIGTSMAARVVVALA